MNYRIGATAIRYRVRSEALNDILSIVLGAGAIVAGIPMVLTPTKARENTEKIWQARLAELDAGAEERFFEERRTLRAYPPLRSDAKKRAFGAFLLLLGLNSIFQLFLR